MDTWTVILSALVGGLVTAISSVAIIWITKHFDEKRARREVILKSAMESYAQYCQNAQKSGQIGMLTPVSDHILLMAYFADKCLDGTDLSENVEQHLAEVDEMYKRMRNYREGNAPKRR